MSQENNPIINHIMSHKSIRRFKQGAKIPETHIEIILRAGQQASTSCSGQMYSFIRISPNIREQVFSACGKQNFVVEASEFFILCVDKYRLDRLVEKAGGPPRQWPLASLVIGVMDLGLAAQNIALAAEALGYGIVFCGSCADHAGELIDLLGLPKKVLPITGLAIGVPEEKPPVRPRIPLGAVYHKDHYHVPSEKELDQWIEQMGSALTKEGYYQKYAGREVGYTWKDHLVRKFGGKWLERVEKTRKDILEKQGFL